MRYVRPSSLTWWAGLAALLTGLASLMLPDHGELAALSRLVAELSGAGDAAPMTLITLERNPISLHRTRSFRSSFEPLGA